MPASQYTVTFNSPCSASIVVDQVFATRYVGNSAFGTAILQRTKDKWVVTIVPEDPGSACAPSTIRNQDTPDVSDPIGSYGNGDADVSSA